MKTYYSTELNMRYDDFLHLRNAGKVRLGIDNEVAFKVTHSKLMPKRSSAVGAMGLWGWVGVVVLFGSIYLSFTSAWWWFIPGLALASLLHVSNKQANSSNLLDLGQSDADFYERLRVLGLWQYQMEEADAAQFLSAS